MSLDDLWPDADRRDDALERLLARTNVPLPRDLRGALSREESEALRVLSAGLTVKEGSELLGISRFAFRDRLLRARRVLAAKTTVQAVAVAVRQGLIP